MPNNSLAYFLCFEPKQDEYGPAAAQACLGGLKQMGFTGRCECYARDVPHPPFHLIGLGLKNAEGDTQPSYEWWLDFVQAVAEAAEPTGAVTLDTSNSEMGELDEIRTNFLSRGTVEFVQGRPQWIYEDEDSWFIGECKRIIGCEAQRM